MKKKAAVLLLVLWVVLSLSQVVYDGSKIDLGDGFYLLSENIDSSSTVMGLTVTSDQMRKLLSRRDFSSELQAISQRVYAKVNDDFDFIFFVLDKTGEEAVNALGGLYGINLGVSNDIEGLGTYTYSNASAWGSKGKLKSAMYFPFYNAIANGPALHELCHNWAAFICPTYDEDNDRYDGHWGFSNAGGQLGGAGYIRVVEANSGGVLGRTRYQGSMYPDLNSDGSFEYGGFGLNANGGNSLPYSDIELYLMGMKSAQELRAANFRLNIYSGISFNPGDGNEGYFFATEVTSYTIDDLIALNGPRIPDSASSQKQFKVLTVVLNEAGVQSYIQEIIKNIQWFSGPLNDNTYYYLYNFSQATNGIGSLVTSGVKNSLINAAGR
jgi:hypothetical protein